MSNDNDVTSKPQGFTVVDRRGNPEPAEVCRVCGSGDVHARHYNQPTMDCIRYLRERIAALTLAAATVRPGS